MDKFAIALRLTQGVRILDSLVNSSVENTPISTKSSAKLDYLSWQLEEIVASDQKALVFSQFPNKILGPLSRHLQQYETAIFHGGLSDRQGERMLDDFEHRKTPKVLLTSVKSGGTGFKLACKQTFNPTFSGNVTHLRDYVHVNVNVSDSPYLHGINTTFANAEINGKSGNVSIRGTMRLEPTAFPGSAWEGNWVFIGSKGTAFGRAVAQGIGDLEGMTLFMDLYDWTGFDQGVADAACEAVSYDGQPVSLEASHTVTEGTIVVSSRQ